MKRFAALMIAGSMLALGGCASTSDLAAAKAHAQRANDAAAKAQATADAATKRLNAIEATAAQALAEAQKTSQAAAAAQAAAADAKKAAADATDAAKKADATSAQVNERIDRMFKKAMMKYASRIRP